MKKPPSGGFRSLGWHQLITSLIVDHHIDVDWFKEGVSTEFGDHAGATEYIDKQATFVRLTDTTTVGDTHVVHMDTITLISLSNLSVLCFYRFRTLNYHITPSQLLS